MSILLLLTLAIPGAAAGLLMVFRHSLTGHMPRWFALVAAVATLAVSIGLAHEFRDLPAPADASSPVQPRFDFRYPWFNSPASAFDTGDTGDLKLEFHFGVDGISMALIVLTTILTVSCVLISWESIAEREAEFYTALLALETGLIGVFCAFDLVLFYVAFEFTLIPLFFLIGIWGGSQRRYAAIKFFLYTLAGSLVTLLGVVALVLHASSTGLESPCSIPELAAWLKATPLDPKLQIGIFLALATGFAVKVPVVPLHTWLPLAHVEAPTAGSVLLAGVLLKLGSYGFLRLCLPLLPDACLTVGLPLFGILAVVGIIYGSFCSLAQRDIKKLVAYSSVAHMGFCLLGLFALNAAGLAGGVMQMINHGLSTGALFLLVGMIYERYHTRQIEDFGGIAAKLPLLALAMVFISLSSIGLPGLNGFVGEILALAGMFARHPLYAVLGALGLILGAWYLLSMLQYVFFGTFKEPRHGGHPVRDMNLREALSLAPIVVLCFWIGLRPQPLLEVIRPDVDAVAALYEGTEVGARELGAGNATRIPAPRILHPAPLFAQVDGDDIVNFSDEARP